MNGRCLMGSKSCLLEDPHRTTGMIFHLHVSIYSVLYQLLLLFLFYNLHIFFYLYMFANGPPKGVSQLLGTCIINLIIRFRFSASILHTFCIFSNFYHFNAHWTVHSAVVFIVAKLTPYFCD